MVDAVKALFYFQFAAVRTPGIIEPGPFVHADRLNHKRVVVHPFAHRISIPSRFGVLGEFSSVGPNRAPGAKHLIQHHDLVRSLGDFDDLELIKLDAREARRVADVQRIVTQYGGNRSDAHSRRLMGFERGLAQSRVRQMTRDFALVGLAARRAIVAWQYCGVFVRTRILDSRRRPSCGIACRVPDPEEVAAGSRGGLYARVRWFVEGDAVPGCDLDVVYRRRWSRLSTQSR